MPKPHPKPTRAVSEGHLPMMERLLARVSQNDLHWLTSMETQELRALLDLVQTAKRHRHADRRAQSPYRRRLKIGYRIEPSPQACYRSSRSGNAIDVTRPIHKPGKQAMTRSEKIALEHKLFDADAKRAGFCCKDFNVDCFSGEIFAYACEF